MTLEEEIADLKAKVNLYRYDFLTGLKMRLDFDHDIRKKFHSDDTFNLIMFDVDGLHKINRIYGYEAGDSLIREVSNDIRHQSIPHETYRISGDEFMVIACSLLPHEVKNATSASVNSDDFKSVKDMISKVDELLTAKKIIKKTRRIDD